MKRFYEFVGQLLWDYNMRHEGRRSRGLECEGVREQRRHNVAAMNTLIAATGLFVFWFGIQIASGLEVDGLFSQAYPAFVGLLAKWTTWLLIGIWLLAAYRLANAYLYDPHA